MSSKTKVTPRKSETAEKEGPQTPLLDLSDVAVKELIRIAKKRGYVVHDQINSLLASDEVNSEQIENILAKFSQMGINVVEIKEARLEEEVVADEKPEEEETEGGNELAEIQRHRAPAKSGAKEPAERTDDPVRLYLREMGSMELLSREGEIAIAKRIEAGRKGRDGEHLSIRQIRPRHGRIVPSILKKAAPRRLSPRPSALSMCASVRVSYRILPGRESNAAWAQPVRVAGDIFPN
jgi:hypothetical protein